MHQILKQVVEIDVHGSEHAGVELQRQVSAVCRESVGAHLEAVFAKFDADDGYTVIDRLDIDFGDVPLERLESVLTVSLSSAVATSLRERGLVPREDGVPGVHDQRLLGPAEAFRAGLLHFLQHGRLPWWYAAETSRPVDAELVALLSRDSNDDWNQSARAAPLRRPHADFIGDLRRLLHADGRARARLLHQFSTSAVMRLLALMDVGLHGRLDKALRLARSLPLGGALRPRLEASLVEAAIGMVASEPHRAMSGTVDDLLRVAAVALAPRLSDDERRRLERGTGVTLPVDLAACGPPPVPAPVEDQAVARDGLLVNNAGVVLLHSFLPRFLAELDCVRHGDLVNAERATLLLHHLATGALTAGESELVFAKVLCGLPIESILPREAQVTAREQAEASALLDSAVRHWAVLRNTTADGLRGNFLVRPGRLEPKENDWLLRVEARSHDLLLDSLPWGIAHVKLPWMTRLMHVEWAP